MTLEFDDEVLSYEEQPLRINYEYKDGVLFLGKWEILIMKKNLKMI